MDEMRIQEGHKREGTEILRIRIILPQWETCPTRSAFYCEIGRLAASFCRERLLACAEAAYDEDPDPKKRFRFRAFRYTLIGEAREEGERVRVRLAAELVETDGTRRRFSDEQIWEGETLVKR